MKKILLVLWIISLTTGRSFAQWESEATGFSVQRGINQIVSPSANVVWATAYNPFTVFLPCRDYCKSTDGGNTWTAATITDASTHSIWICVSATDENNAWALLYDFQLFTGTLWKTSDGGSTWTQQGAGVIYTSSTSFPDIIHFWDADTGVVIGDPVNGDFEIYTTTDGGTTWTQADNSNIPDALAEEYGAAGFSESVPVYHNIIWFGTNSGRIFKSTDRGHTWAVQETGLGDIYPLVFKDENNGWLQTYDADGYFIDMYRTTDGGATWNNITPSENFYINAMCYVPGTQ